MKFFRRRPRAGGVVFGDVVFVSSCRRVFRGYALCTRFSEIVGVLGRCGFCENRLASMRVRPASVRAGFFLLLVQEKETKEKDNPAVSPSAHPARKVRTRWPVAPTAHPCADGAMSAIHRAPPSGRFGHRPPPLKGPGKARQRAPARRSRAAPCGSGFSRNAPDSLLACAQASFQWKTRLTVSNVVTRTRIVSGRPARRKSLVR